MGRQSLSTATRVIRDFALMFARSTTSCVPCRGDAVEFAAFGAGAVQLGVVQHDDREVAIDPQLLCRLGVGRSKASHWPSRLDPILTYVSSRGRARRRLGRRSLGDVMSWPRSGPSAVPPRH